MLSDSSAVEIGERITRGELRPLEVVEHYLGRIRDWDAELASFVEVHDERVRRDAARSPSSGPLAGVPVAIKDLNAKVMTIAQTNAKAAFDHAEALVKAADPQEALALQTEYLKAQMAALQEQAKELGEAAKSAMTPKA